MRWIDNNEQRGMEVGQQVRDIQASILRGRLLSFYSQTPEAELRFLQDPLKDQGHVTIEVMPRRRLWQYWSKSVTEPLRELFSNIQVQFYFHAHNKQNMEKTQQPACMCTLCNLFFATASTNYLCSGCYKKTNTTKIQQKSTEPQTVTSPPPPATNSSQPTTQQADPTRCHKCKKNVGLLGVNCKCGFIYCNKHRMPEEHECGVDYRKIGKEELAKEFQVVAPRKLSEI